MKALAVVVSLALSACSNADPLPTRYDAGGDGSAGPLCARRTDPPAPGPASPTSAAAGPDGRIYVTASAFYPNLVPVWSYDVTTNTWTSLPNAPGLGADAYRIAWTHTSLYALRSVGRAPPALFAYDPKSNQWVQRPSVAPDVSPVALTSGGSHLYAIGVTSGPDDAAWQYDEVTDTWSRMAKPPLGPSGLPGLYTAAYVGSDKVISVGLNGPTGVNLLDVAANSWSALGAPPTTRDGAMVVYDNANTAYDLVGICDGGVACKGGDAFALPTQSWSTLPDLPVALQFYQAAAFGCDGRLYVFGAPLSSTASLTQRYDPATNTWQVGAMQ